MIRFKNVSKSYDSVLALKYFSLEVEKGKTDLLLGLSGSGAVPTALMALFLDFILVGISA